MTQMTQMTSELGKLLVFSGLILTLVGVVLLVGPKLPGDIVFRSRNTIVFFPIVTCLLLSALGTLVLWLISFFRRP